MDEVRRETAQSHLAHEAKIQALQNLVEADDYEQLAFDDRERVRQQYQKKLGINTTDESGLNRRGSSSRGDNDPLSQLDQMGHILGDVTIEQPRNKNPLTNLIVPLATLGLVGAIAWKLIDSNEAAPLDGTDKITNVVPGFGDPNAVQGK